MINVVGNTPIMTNSDKNIGVVGSGGTKTLQFSIDRMQGLVDLNGFGCWALIERSPANGGLSYPAIATKALSDDGNKIIVSLPITTNETRDYGYIYAALVFATSKDISAFAYRTATTTTVTSVGHGLAEGVTTDVIISGTTNYNGQYDVTWIDADNFYFDHEFITNQTGWFGIGAVWQTEKVLLRVSKGIDGETESGIPSTSPTVLAQYMTAFTTATGEINSLLQSQNEQFNYDFDGVFSKIDIVGTVENLDPDADNGYVTIVRNSEQYVNNPIYLEMNSFYNTLYINPYPDLIVESDISGVVDHNISFQSNALGACNIFFDGFADGAVTNTLIAFSISEISSVAYVWESGTYFGEYFTAGWNDIVLDNDNGTIISVSPMVYTALPDFSDITTFWDFDDGAYPWSDIFGRYVSNMPYFVQAENVLYIKDGDEWKSTYSSNSGSGGNNTGSGYDVSNDNDTDIGSTTKVLSVAETNAHFQPIGSYLTSLSGAVLTGDVSNAFETDKASTTKVYSADIVYDQLAGKQAVGSYLTTSSNIDWTKIIGTTKPIVTTGTSNTLVGSGNGSAITTGTKLSAIGYQSLNKNTSGGGNTAHGYRSLYSNTTGTYNTGVGSEVLYKNTTGVGNTAQGNGALYENIDGVGNTAQGFSSLNLNVNGEYNTAQGFSSLSQNISGNYNVAIGYYAGDNVNTSENSVFIGSNANTNLSDGVNEIVIGCGAYGSGSNTATLGNEDILTTVLRGDVYIGTSITNADGTAPAVGITPETGDDSTQLATTAFVQASLPDAFLNSDISTDLETDKASDTKVYSAKTVYDEFATKQDVGDYLTTESDIPWDSIVSLNKPIISTEELNTFIGLGCGTANTTGTNNAGEGAYALGANTTGNYNSAQGSHALYSNTTGSWNSAQGVDALYYNDTGNHNSAQGNQALYSNISGNDNTAQGHQSLYNNTTGSNNTAQGYLSLCLNTTGYDNSAQGYQSLFYNTTGNSNCYKKYK